VARATFEDHSKIEHQVQESSACQRLCLLIAIYIAFQIFLYLQSGGFISLLEHWALGNMLAKPQTMKHSALSLYLAALSFCVVAQLPERLYFKHITPNEGLAQSVVASIYKDHRGFMWFSSYDGISRFDGVQCQSNSEIAPGWNIHHQYMRICGDEQYIYTGPNLALKRFNIAAIRFEDVLVHDGDSNKPRMRQVVGTPLAVRAGHVLIDKHKGRYSIINTDTGMEIDSVLAHSPDGRITPFEGVYFGSIAFADVDGDQDVLITG
jgi:hypothetical protein